MLCRVLKRSWKTGLLNNAMLCRVLKRSWKTGLLNNAIEVALSYVEGTPPITVLAAAAVTGLPLKLRSELPTGSHATQTFFLNGKLHGTEEIFRYTGHITSLPDFYSRSDFETSQIDQWMKDAGFFPVGADFEKVCANIGNYLLQRGFLVGYSVDLGDIAAGCPLPSSSQRWDSIWNSKKYQNLVPLYNSTMSEHSLFNDTIPTSSEVGKPSTTSLMENNAAEGNMKKKCEGSFDIDLPGAEMGKVCTRFPPEPSGYLHIGHAKAALLNQYFAERYNGKLLIRFDDTNPSKENNEFVDSILKDLDTLGIKGDISYTSDYFPQLVKMAEKLISEGEAYVDDTPREQMQKERMNGIESKNRNNTVEYNMHLWREMVSGTQRGKQCCLRGKLDMQAVNKSLRDPVYYRCNPTPHHRVGSKYNVYPTYDFACPYVDSIEGVTHALRSNEYHDRNEQYYRIIDDMGVRKVHVWDFSRLNLVNTLLSKRKLQWFVDNGKVEGWDDPRFPTIRGILRRGLTLEALKQFILSQGASKNLNLMEWDKLWTINKKIIDPVCPRHTAVIEKGRTLLFLRNGPNEPFDKTLPRHKKNENTGTKTTTYTKRIWIDGVDAAVVSEGEEVTLMDWGNAIIEQIEKDENGNALKLSGVLHLEGSVKTTKLKLTWLADISELVNLSLVEFDHLITKKKLDESDNFLDVLNPHTKWETLAVGDANMRNLKHGEILQLERKGYFRCDVPFSTSSKPVVLIAIPDGRKHSVLKKTPS